MNRFPDWKKRLIEYLYSVSQRQFSYGQHDCALFVAGAVEAMTGVNYAKDWVGKYTTLSAGMKKLKKMGHDDHVAYVASILDEKKPVFAATGDVVVVDGDAGFGALGIVQGASVYVLSETGIALVPRSKILKAFEL